MSRSTVLKKELFSGIHLVEITEAKPHEGNILIKFSDGANKSFEKVYDFTSSEFLKMCYSAGTITDDSIFDAKESIGKRLWICIKECWTITNDSENVSFEIFDTPLYVVGTTGHPKVKGNPQDDKCGTASGVFYESNVKLSHNGVPLNFTSDKKTSDVIDSIAESLPSTKAKVIAEAKEMIKKVESGVKAKPEPIDDDFDSM